jgi:hypothetical protein
MWCIIVAIVCEYIFLVVNIIYIIRTLIKDRKKGQEYVMQKDENGKLKKVKPGELEQYFVYKWIQ